MSIAGNRFKSQFNRYLGEHLLVCFMGGLNEDIKVDVRAMKLTSFVSSFKVAIVFEERHTGHGHIYIGSPPH